MIKLLQFIIYIIFIKAQTFMRSPKKCDSYPCLIFHDDFNTLDFSTWQHIISASATGNNEFQYYTNNRSNSFIKDSVLHLKPTLTNDTRGDDFLTSGKLDLWGTTRYSTCTSNRNSGCMVEGSNESIIHPIQSAALRTVDSFSFKYGKIEVRAKCSRGDWLWPAIWLMPKYDAYGSWPASGEIDIMELRGNNQLKSPLDQNKSRGNDQVTQSLHWGPFVALNGQPKTTSAINIDGSFSNGFHKFGMIWSKDKISFYTDNKTTLEVSAEEIGNFWKHGGFSTLSPNAANPWLSGTNLAPFDQEFYIILNVAVGGTNGYFHDSYLPKQPWDNYSPRGKAMKQFWDARHSWLPTWKGDDTSLKIDYVKVWKMNAAD